MDDIIQTKVIIKNCIFTIRGQKVMIDRDLADLYGVPTKRLNEAVKRNIKRFPEDFMFKLNDKELKELVANCDRFETLKHSTTPPNAFTEQGVSMLSSVLNSERAIAINVEIIRTFVQLRQFAIENKELAQRLSELERYFMQHCKDYNSDIIEIKQAIDLLMDRTKTTKIGFKV